MSGNSTMVEAGAVPLSTWLSAPSFWYPAYVDRSAWLEHAPFAFWITSALKPRSFVELGTHGGYSYFAFCQAVKELGLATSCYAVDTWKGDEHAGFYGEEVFERVRDHNDMRYSAFSRLVRSTFDEALSSFPDASLDLLHIDGRHFYEDVRQDFESWECKLSDRAVVLFHDTNVHERGFGVFKLWAQLKERLPAFEFLHGHGLGVLGYGSNLPNALRAFFEATADPREANLVREAYARLGAAIKGDMEVSELQVRFRAIEERATQLAARVQAREAEVVELKTTLRTQKERADVYRDKWRMRRRQAEAALLSSMSWRVTAPLRAVSRLSRWLLRNLRRAMLLVGWLVTGRFSRAAKAALPYYHKVVPAVRNHSAFALVRHVEALAPPSVDPYAGRPYAEIRDERIVAQQHRRVDVVVCVHNALDDVRQCLDSIKRARRSENQRLILIDDGSDEPTAKFLEEFARDAAWVQLHRSGTATGYTMAANRGIAASTGELVIFLNSDTIVTDGWAEKMADAVFSTSGAGVVGPLSNAASLQSIPNIKSANGQTAINELPAGVSAEDMNRYCESWTVAGVLPLVPLIHGFCFGVTRDVIDAIGHFDEARFPRGYGEEMDYCFRATDAGFGLVVATHTYVFHAKSKSYGSNRAALTKTSTATLLQLYGRIRIDRVGRSMRESPPLVALREQTKRLYVESERKPKVAQNASPALQDGGVTNRNMR